MLKFKINSVTLPLFSVFSFVFILLAIILIKAVSQNREFPFGFFWCPIQFHVIQKWKESDFGANTDTAFYFDTTAFPSQQRCIPDSDAGWNLRKKSDTI